MKEAHYTLSFMEAVEACLGNKGFVRGEDFAPGVYVKSEAEELVFFDGATHKKLGSMFITTGIVNQKYKLFSVASRKELELL